MLKFVSCFFAALALVLVASTPELAAQEASNDEKVYLDQMNKFAEIIEEMSSKEDLAEAEEELTAVFTEIATLVREADDPTTIMALEQSEEMQKINARIESAAMTFVTTSEGAAVEFQQVMARSTQPLMMALMERGLIPQPEAEVETMDEMHSNGGM